MKKYIVAARDYLAEHKVEFTVGAGIALVIAIVIFSIALYSYNTRPPKIIYEPARACDLLTLDEAKEFLGTKTINGVATNPEQSGNTAISKCSYSDGKIDTANAIVAAIIVRSGINDQGIQQNKTQFANGKPATNVETVKDVGDSAYFNKTLGQLNILKDSTWIIISYGPATSPADNTLSDAIALAKKVVN